MIVNLGQRIVRGIKDQPWASRPFNVIVNDRHADLWGFGSLYDQVNHEKQGTGSETCKRYP